ncbi:hypothetical protein D3C86_1850630 [compost metagenome]
MHPALTEVVAGVEADQPDPENQGGDHRRQHDAAIQLALHHAEAFAAGLVFAHGVVDKQAWQIEQPGEPADHGDDVQGFEPQKEHCPTPGRLNWLDSSGLCPIRHLRGWPLAVTALSSTAIQWLFARGK